MKEPSSTIRAQAVALAFVFTILTYFLVETPIRHLKKTIAVRIAIASLVAVVAATGAAGYYVNSKEGFPERFPEMAAAKENLVKKLPRKTRKNRPKEVPRSV